MFSQPNVERVELFDQFRIRHFPGIYCSRDQGLSEIAHNRMGDAASGGKHSECLYGDFMSDNQIDNKSVLICDWGVVRYDTICGGNIVAFGEEYFMMSMFT